MVYQKDVIKKLQNTKRIQEVSRMEKHLPPTQDGGLEEQLAFCHGREQKPRVSQTSKFWRKPSPPKSVKSDRNLTTILGLNSWHSTFTAAPVATTQVLASSFLGLQSGNRGS